MDNYLVTEDANSCVKSKVKDKVESFIKLKKQFVETNVIKDASASDILSKNEEL